MYNDLIQKNLRYRRIIQTCLNELNAKEGFDLFFVRRFV